MLGGRARPLFISGYSFSSYDRTAALGRRTTATLPRMAAASAGAVADTTRVARLYALELLVRDAPGILLSPADLETLNQHERAITQSLRGNPAPAGAGPSPRPFVPWGSDEQRRFVHCVRLTGADSRSPRELWRQLAHGSGQPALAPSEPPFPPRARSYPPTRSPPIFCHRPQRSRAQAALPASTRAQRRVCGPPCGASTAKRRCHTCRSRSRSRSRSLGRHCRPCCNAVAGDGAQCHRHGATPAQPLSPVSYTVRVDAACSLQPAVR